MIALIKNELIKYRYNRKVYGFMVILFLLYLLPVFITFFTRMKTQDTQTFPLTMYGLTVSWAIPIFLIALIAETITEEYTAGTLSLSLVHPVTRAQFILSKFFSYFLLILALLFYSLALGYGIGALFFSWGNGFLIRGITYTTAEGLRYTIGSYLAASGPLLSFCAFIMFLSLTISGSAAVVSLGTGLLFSFYILNLLVDDLGTYLISSYLGAVPGLLFFTYDPADVQSALVFITLHGLLFLLCSLFIFRRRDILL